MSMMSIVFNVSVLFAVARFCGNSFVCRRFQRMLVSPLEFFMATKWRLHESSMNSKFIVLARFFMIISWDVIHLHKIRIYPLVN